MLYVYTESYNSISLGRVGSIGKNFTFFADNG